MSATGSQPPPLFGDAGEVDLWTARLEEARVTRPDAQRGPLPIDALLDDIRASLRTVPSLVIEAAPGAGKTTAVPLALLEEPWVGDGRIIVLEPRRVAARAAATRMSKTLGRDVGTVVGFSTRDDRRVSRQTRIEVVTEGILLRRIQRDPSLEGVAAVIFDEVHERRLDADLALAFVLEARKALRPDLRVIAMSATVIGEDVAATLGGAPVIRSDVAAHAVETSHEDEDRRRVIDRVAGHVERALETTDGHILVFLPGAGEIRRVQKALTGLGTDAIIAPLYGSLPPGEQDRALAPTSGVRKVVLATDLAETSVTIDGVTTVIDTGLARRPAYDPNTGMARLVTGRVSRASADQRRGRAGRTGPGRCIRLWSASEDARLDAHAPTEIATTDLARFALEVAAWGARDASDLLLPEQPPRPAYEQACDLLRVLGALDTDNAITEHGRAMNALPLHPRLSHVVIRAAGGRDAGLACDLAALLGERDLLRPGVSWPSVDLADRLIVLHGGSAPAGSEVRRAALQVVRRQAKRLRALQSTPIGGVDVHRAGAVLAPGYVDRIARPRSERGTFVLGNGRGVRVADDDPMASVPFVVVADADDAGSDGRVRLAAATTEAELRAALPEHVHTEDVVGWSEEEQQVVSERRTVLGGHILSRQPLEISGDERARALLGSVRTSGLRTLGNWTADIERFRDRIAFLRRTFGEEVWPDLSDAALTSRLDQWALPFLGKVTSQRELVNFPLLDALQTIVGWDKLRRVDVLAPTHLEVPSGAKIPLDYAADPPVLSARVQQMFGATSTPTIAGGRVEVVVHLLSPAGRPVQVTRDLAGFWDGTYHEVRAQLRGRYPKHPWPDDPRQAVATDRARPRSR